MLLKGTKEIICEVPDISFGNELFKEAEGADCETLSYSQVETEEFNEYISKLKITGFEEREAHKFGENTFSLLSNENSMLLISYYPGVLQMRIVAQHGEMKLNYYDNNFEDKVTSKLTMIDLEDFGESIVLRLADGRFIVFDGGFPFENDADKLMSVLNEQSPQSKPHIAAWVFTHPHVDHYRCFLVFYPKYKNDVIIDRFIYNFPEATDDLSEKLSGLTSIYTDEIECIRKLENLISESSVPVIRAHTGQIFNISNAKIEVLSSMDDTCNYPCDANILSLVFKITIEGQVMLFGSDGLLEKSHLGEKYGNYLKADILQVPHHGFNADEGDVYKLINPDVCLVEAKDVWFYKEICIYLESNKVLLYDLNVKEVFTGGCGNVSFELPYIPKENGNIVLFEKIKEKQKEIGAKSWFFTDVSIDECKFTLVNTTNYGVSVDACLYFDSRKDFVSNIKINADSMCVTRIDLKKSSDDNGNPLIKKEMLSEKKFTVHFQSEVPVVMSGITKPGYYY